MHLKVFQIKYSMYIFGFLLDSYSSSMFNIHHYQQLHRTSNTKKHLFSSHSQTLPTFLYPEYTCHRFSFSGEKKEKKKKKKQRKWIINSNSTSTPIFSFTTAITHSFRITNHWSANAKTSFFLLEYFKSNFI